MSLVGWNDSPFQTVNRLMGTAFNGFENDGKMFEMDGSTFVPKLDISEDKENFYIIAELPGLEEQDVKVTVNDGVLTVSGEKERKEEKRTRNFYRIERSFGEFVRSFSLPSNIKEGAIEGTFKNGLLELTLPKTEAAQKTGRSIPLTTKEPDKKLKTPQAVVS